MNRRSLILAALADLGCGFLAFVVVRVMPLFTGQHQDIRPFVLTTFLSFLGAAFFRGGRAVMQDGPTFLFLSLGGIAPAVTLRLLGISLTANPFFVLFLSTSVSAIALGIMLKVLSMKGRTTVALMAGCLCTLLIAGAAYKTIPNWLDGRAYEAVNNAVAPFSMKTLDGQSVSSDDLRGHVVVISFWATWCLPCQAELPKIQSVSKRYSANPRVSILAIDSGTEGDTPEKVRSYLLKKRLSLSVLVDSPDGESPGPAARSLHVPSLPALYIFDSAGRLRSIHLGYEASEDLESSLSLQIDRLL